MLWKKTNLYKFNIDLNKLSNKMFFGLTGDEERIISSFVEGLKACGQKKPSSIKNSKL